MYHFIILCLSSPASKSYNIPQKADFYYRTPTIQQMHRALHVNNLASAKALHFLFHPIAFHKGLPAGTQIIQFVCILQEEALTHFISASFAPVARFISAGITST